MTDERIGEATIERALDPGHLLRIAQGDFTPVFAAYEEHAVRWELPVDATTRRHMQHGLAALALHLALLESDQRVGITVHVASPPLSVFLTGDAGEHNVTGRVFVDDVRRADANRLYVQSFRPQTGVSQSTLDVRSDNLLGMFEEYFERSEQFPARVLSLGGSRYALVQALPDGGRERLEAMADEDVVALCAGPRDMVFQETFRFRCGCNPGRIVHALRQMFEGQDEELFRGEPGVEAFCPRCGARWWIERSVYDAAPPAG